MTADDATLTGYVVAVVALVGLQLRRRSVGGMDLGRLSRWITGPRTGWVLVFLAWAWLGWHLFARGSAAFLR
jgi:hypothetical protein